jgi:hypothetical protein
VENFFKQLRVLNGLTYLSGQDRDQFLVILGDDGGIVAVTNENKTDISGLGQDRREDKMLYFKCLDYFFFSFVGAIDGGEVMGLIQGILQGLFNIEFF